MAAHRYHSRRTLTRKQPRIKRECLKCGATFMARGRFNRICPKCTETNRAYALTATYTTYAYL